MLLGPDIDHIFSILARMSLIEPIVVRKIQVAGDRCASRSECEMTGIAVKIY